MNAGRAKHRRTTRRLLASTMLAAGAIAGTTVSANAATTATFSSGVLTVSGDSLDNTIVVSRDAAGKILVNNGAVAVIGGTPTVANTASIRVFGLGGNDVITLNEANGALPAAILFGGAGNDTLSAGSGADQLFGQAGNDTLLGRGGNDLLFGVSDNDTLTGGDADDQVFGQGGNDRMVWNPVTTPTSMRAVTTPTRSRSTAATAPSSSPPLPTAPASGSTGSPRRRSRSTSAPPRT